MSAVGRNHPCTCGSGRKYKVCCLARDEAQRKPAGAGYDVLVCMPTRGQICYETHLALTCNLRDVKHAVCLSGRELVVDARNKLARSAVNAFDTNPFPYVLWVDDDAWWQPGTASVFVRALSEMPKLDILFGSFCARMPYQSPLAYQRANDGESFPKVGIDCERGDIVRVERAGFHFVMMRTRVLKAMGPDPFSIPSGSDGGEDWAFCVKAAAAGFNMGVGTAMPIFHLDPRDGTAYAPGMPAMMMDGNSLQAITLDHLGAGGFKASELRSYGNEIDPQLRSRERQEENKVARAMETRRRIAEQFA